MTGSRRELAARMADATLALLATLDGERQAAAAWPFPSDDERTRWYYTPTDHGGVALVDLAPAQQRLALQLVASGLSAAGYGTVATIMGLENILDLTEGWRATFPGRERAAIRAVTTCGSSATPRPGPGPGGWGATTSRSTTP